MTRISTAMRLALLSVAVGCSKSAAPTPPGGGVSLDAGTSAVEFKKPARTSCAATRGACCEIALNDCPSHPSHTAWSGVDSQAATTGAACRARAGYYLSWCKAQLPVSATYWTDGHLEDQQIASLLDGKASTELLPDEVAGLANPRIRFANGKVLNGAPDVYAEYPDIKGFAPTAWFVTQWKKSDHMQAPAMSRDDAATLDPVFGLSNYAFPTKRGVSHARFYADPTDAQHKRQVFELFGSGGLYDSAGGSGEHLSSYLLPDARVDAPVTLSFNGKLKKLSSRLGPTAKRNDVVGIWYSLLTASFTNPETGAVTHAFLQMLHANTRGGPPERYVDFYQFYENTSATVNYIHLFPEDASQYFTAADPSGPLRPVQFDVSKYLCDMVQTPIPRADGTTYSFPASARVLSNWTLNSFAIGLETHETVLDATGTPVNKGQVEISYQVSDIHVRKYPGTPASFAGCSFKATSP